MPVGPSMPAQLWTVSWTLLQEFVNEVLVAGSLLGYVS